MYGFADKTPAEFQAAKLGQLHPENRYEVKPHSWTPNNSPLTWGVVRYVPYCEQMPMRCDGFVWFSGGAQ